MAAANDVEPSVSPVRSCGRKRARAGESSSAWWKYSIAMRWHQSENAWLMQSRATVPVISHMRVRSSGACAP